MHIFVIALGKASPAMCRAARLVLRSRLTSGVAAVPRYCESEPPERITYVRAGHPLPDEGSLAAARAAFSMLRGTTREDLVLVLVSGGGSAMFELPIPGIGLGRLRSLSHELLLSGVAIDAINEVRGEFSQVKAGGLLQWAAPARCVGLILSDVVGDDIARVASGPTIPRGPDRRLGESVLAVLPPWARKYMPGICPQQGPRRRSLAPRTPINVLIGSNHDLIAAADEEARQLGFSAHVLTGQLSGEASQAGLAFAKRLTRERGPACLLMGGETTVTVRGAGRGGRNQEFALAAALGLEDVSRVALMSVASDGIDGPTDAAGAMVTGETAGLARRLRVDQTAGLAHNDAYSSLSALGSLVFTGPTGTNLNDLVVGLAYG